MKWFSLMILLLFGTLSVQALTEEDLEYINTVGNRNVYDSVGEFLEEKCKSAGHDAADKNIADVVSKARMCVENYLPRNKEDLDKTCTEGRVQIRNCFSDTVHVWEDCSNQEEKYLVGFLFDILDAVAEYVCADGGAVLDKFLKEDYIKCLETLGKKENASDVCEDKLKVLRDDIPVVFSKADICQDLSTTKACYEELIKNECPEGTNYREAIIGLIDAVSSPCKKHRRDLFGLPLPYSKH